MRAGNLAASRLLGSAREHFDWTLFLVASVLAVIGVVNLYSATSVSRASLSEVYIQQVYWLVSGGILAMLVTSIDYRHFERLGYAVYGFGIVLYFTAERGHSKPVFKWRSRYWSFLLKLSPDLPSWTIQARRSNNMGPFHWQNRILRLEEIRRLQTFPDCWQLAGTTEQQWRQLGNAVPPLLAQSLGQAIRDHIYQAIG